MKLFLKAIADKLRTDTGVGSLVTLTSHTASNIRIAAESPKIAARYPFLGISDEVSFPKISNSPATEYKETTIKFSCVDTNKINAIDIADRLEVLLHIAGADQHEKYYTVTDSNIMNCMTKFITRVKPVHDEDIDSWTVEILADFTWYLK